MQIGADSAALDCTLPAILPVVAKPAHDFRQRLCAGAKVGASAMVFEANQMRPLPAAGDVADAARHVGTRVNRFYIENAESGHHSAVGVAI